MRAVFFAVLTVLLWSAHAVAQEPAGGDAARADPVDPFASDADGGGSSILFRRSLITNIHIADLRVAIGGHLDGGVPGLGERAGFHLAAGFDGFSNEVLGARLRALSFDFVWNQGAGQALVMPMLLRLDYLFFGASDGGICPAPFLTVWPATHCDPQSGYVGLGGSLLGIQHDTETPLLTSRTRDALRVGEVYAVFSFLPAFEEAFAERRLPISVGASLDYFWNLNSDPLGRSEVWVGRALLAVDGLYRFADFNGAVEGRLAYRPSFTDWGGDYAVEVSLRLLYQDFHTLYRRQGDTFRLVFEVGYAHWSVPQHSVGFGGAASAAGWAGYGNDSGFIRIGFEPTVWNVP